MSIDRVKFESIANGGDTPTAAFVKLDANDADLDARVTQAQADASTAGTTATDAQTTATTAKNTADAANATANTANATANAATNTLANTGLGVRPSPTLANLDGVTFSAVQKYAASAGTSPPDSGYGIVLTGSYSTGDYAQLAMSVVGNSIAYRYLRGADGTGWKAWNKIWHTGNTTTDANNFIKKA